MEERLTPTELLAKYHYTGKLTPQLQETAIDMVLSGTPKKTALRALGVKDSTIRLWQRHAETNEKGDKYGALFAALDTAEQQSLSKVASNAQRLTEKDGRVALDYLSRRDSEHWGRKDELNVNVNVAAEPIFAAMFQAQQKLASGEFKLLREGHGSGETEGTTEGETEASQGEP